MTDYERGYRAGIEAAAKAMEEQFAFHSYAGSTGAAIIRALSQPLDTTPSPAAPPPHDGEGYRPRPTTVEPPYKLPQGTGVTQAKHGRNDSYQITERPPDPPPQNPPHDGEGA